MGIKSLPQSTLRPPAPRSLAPGCERGLAGTRPDHRVRQQRHWHPRRCGGSLCLFTRSLATVASASAAA